MHPMYLEGVAQGVYCGPHAPSGDLAGTLFGNRGKGGGGRLKRVFSGKEGRGLFGKHGILGKTVSTLGKAIGTRTRAETEEVAKAIKEGRPEDLAALFGKEDIDDLTDEEFLALEDEVEEAEAAGLLDDADIVGGRGRGRRRLRRMRKRKHRLQRRQQRLQSRDREQGGRGRSRGGRGRGRSRGGRSTGAPPPSDAPYEEDYDDSYGGPDYDDELEYDDEYEDERPPRRERRRVRLNLRDEYRPDEDERDPGWRHRLRTATTKEMADRGYYRDPRQERIYKRAERFGIEGLDEDELNELEGALDDETGYLDVPGELGEGYHGAMHAVHRSGYGGDAHPGMVGATEDLGPEYRTVKGSGGYTYQQWSDGAVTIADAPEAGKKGIGMTFAAGSDTAQAITREIGPYPDAPAAPKHKRRLRLGKLKIRGKTIRLRSPIAVSGTELGSMSEQELAAMEADLDDALEDDDGAEGFGGYGEYFGASGRTGAHAYDSGITFLADDKPARKGAYNDSPGVNIGSVGSSGFVNDAAFGQRRKVTGGYRADTGTSIIGSRLVLAQMGR